MSTIVVDGPLTRSASAAAEAGSLPAFEAFYVANERRLFRALYVVTGNRHEAEDVMQTAFCKVWERWDKVARVDDPVGYLFRTAFNTHRSAARRAIRAARRVADELSPASPPPEPGDLAEARDGAARALAVLTHRQRQAIVLTVMLGFTGPEAARILRVRPSTVRVLVSQARTALTDGVGPQSPRGSSTDQQSPSTSQREEQGQGRGDEVEDGRG